MSSLADPVRRRTPARRGVRHAGIAGLGCALPATEVANDSIAMRLGVDSGWIERRTGIRTRRRAAPGERVVDLAAAAGTEALAGARVKAKNLDLVLVATFAPDDITPNAAPQVAHALGATRAGAIDVGAACTGFVSGLVLGAGLIESRRAESVLVVGAEILSRFTDPDDRSTAGLFGDGAGAVALAAGAPGDVGPAVLGSDGSAAPYIVAPRSTGVISMDGHETFKRAVSTLVANARDTVAASGLTLDDVDLFVFHQANGRILASAADALGVSRERVVDAIASVGNTSAASIPLALSHARDNGRLRAGDRVLLGAVGAGFTWGATIVTWGQA